MKMDVREFRRQVLEVALSDESVVVTYRGKVLGRFVPERLHPAKEIDLGTWIDARRRFAEKWRSETPDWADRLASYGLDENGEPLQNEAHR